MSKTFTQFIELCKQISPILQEIINNNGIPYMVGGTVRDLILQKPLKDADIEIHNISLEKLESILKNFGPVRLVGKQFGVLLIDGLDIDWSIPRKDSKGRKPVVELDATMTIEQACRRRDITMNAMAIDLKFVCLNFKEIAFAPIRLRSGRTHFFKYAVRGERSGAKSNPYRTKLMWFRKKTNTSNVAKILNIIDPYNGLNDIVSKKLRAVDKQLFTEDPLRFFRVMQFISRFEMQPDEELNEICKSMPLVDPETNTPLARERIHEEIRKMFLKSKSPSLGFRWLEKIGRLEEIFPEIFATIKTPQRPDKHPEGNVFEHSMQSLDAAARFNTYQSGSWGNIDDEKFMIMLAALCHDFGKPLVTDEYLHSKGHEHSGIQPTKTFLKRFMDNTTLISAVCKLVKYHIVPFELVRTEASLKSYKRIAIKLAPETNLRHLTMVAISDRQARNSSGHEPLSNVDEVLKKFLAQAEAAQVVHEPEKAVLQGRHLLDVIQPGPKMGKLLEEAYEIQIEEGINDWQILKQRVLILKK